MKEQTHTKKAFICISIPVLYAAAFLILGFLATVTEKPLERSGIYPLFAAAATFLWLLFPAVQSGCGIVSVVHQIRALRDHESKAKNLAMMVIAALYFVGSILFFDRLRSGMMSV